MRVFVAIEITKKTVIDSIQKFQRDLNIDAKPVDAENLHFTLQFLGQTPDEMLHAICRSLETVKFSEFDVNLKGVGAFPRPRIAKVVWIGVEQGRQLMILAQKIQKVLKPLGFVPDKPFRPHLTVFRVKKIKDVTVELKSAETENFGVQTINSIKLKESKLTLNGPIYSDLLEVKAV